MNQPLHTISAAELNRRFGEAQEHAEAGPVVITHHGKPRHVLLAIQEYEALCDSRVPSGSDAEPLRRKLMLILDNISEGYVSIGNDWRVVTVNRAAEFFLGRVREDLSGKSWAECFPDAQNSAITNMVRRAMDGGESTKMNVRPVSFPMRRVAATVFPLTLPEGGVGILMDNVTERHRLEDRLRHAESDLRHLMRGIEDRIIFLQASDGSVVEWGRGAEVLLGWTASDICGRSVGEICSAIEAESDARMFEFITKVGRRVRAIEREFSNPDGAGGGLRLFTPVD